MKIAESQGFRIINNAFHAVDMRQSEIKGVGGSIDIHHSLFKTSMMRSFEDEMAEGARLIQFFGADVWVPSPENLLLQLLENEYFNLCTLTSQRRHFKWIYDTGLVLSSTLQLDWVRLVDTAKKYGIHPIIQSMLLLLADYLPQYVPKALLANNFSILHSEPISAMEKIVFMHLDWGLQCIRREKLRSAGKKWRALFLWPSQMAAKYRLLRYNGKVKHLWAFTLHHCDAKNFRGVMAWLFAKLSQGMIRN